MLTRLLKMGMGEVAERGRQEATKWLASSKIATVSRRRARRLLDVDHEFAARETLDYFRSTGPGRFFPGATDPLTPGLFTSLTPGPRRRLLESANRVLEGRFDLLGYKDLSFGAPVDWRLDPRSGRTSPLVHWSQIDPTDTAAVGDCKVVWELNRLQFLVTLGVAYRATGDERHAEAFAGFVRAWHRENPIDMGINWASSLEAALRIVSWSWALFLFRSSPQLTPELFWEVMAGIESHAVHIEGYLSKHSSPNTHLTCEALGLFYAGTLFPERASAARWRKAGRRILDAEILRQVLPDGVYFEQTTAYQTYTIEIYLHYLILAGRNRITVPEHVGASVQRMLDVILALRRPDGGVPSIGDQDGGSLLMLGRRDPDDARGVFSLAAGVFARADYAWAAERVQPEGLWLLGPAAVVALGSTGAAPPVQASRVFPDGGYVVMRSGFQRTAHHLVFDVGPLGCPMTGGHGHADLLSVAVSPFGEAFIVDPGTYAYAADPAFRAHFRGTAAHSTVMVDGEAQAEPAGAFGWRERPAARLSRFVSTPEFDLADASHDAYHRLDDPVTHRRRVVFVKSPGYFLIVDDLAGSAEHRIEQRFQLAPHPVTVEANSWISVSGSRGRGLLMRAFAEHQPSTRIETGALNPIAGWVSPNFGTRVKAPMVVFSAVVTLPYRIITLIFPVEHSNAAPPDVLVASPLDGAVRGAIRGLVLPHLKQTVSFDDETVALEIAP